MENLGNSFGNIAQQREALVETYRGLFASQLRDDIVPRINLGVSERKELSSADSNFRQTNFKIPHKFDTDVPLFRLKTLNNLSKVAFAEGNEQFFVDVRKEGFERFIEHDVIYRLSRMQNGLPFSVCVKRRRGFCCDFIIDTSMTAAEYLLRKRYEEWLVSQKKSMSFPKRIWKRLSSGYMTFEEWKTTTFKT
jgi:hypothetical protein